MSLRKTKPLVWIFMGSESDREALSPAAQTLEELGIPFRWEVASAHRAPRKLSRLILQAEREGAVVFIAAAGGAAHLPGVVASQTRKPVIGIPMMTKTFKGIDSLLSILQMPGGVPVATMAVGPAGAKNAAILAAEILALKYPRVRRALERLRPKK